MAPPSKRRVTLSVTETVPMQPEYIQVLEEDQPILKMLQTLEEREVFAYELVTRNVPGA